MPLGSAFLCEGPNEPFLQSPALSYLGKGQETPASVGTPDTFAVICSYLGRILALLYGGLYYYNHYTVNKDNIYGLWQSDHHQLATSCKHIRKRGNIDWQVTQDGKNIIYATRTRPVKRLNDGTLHMELYTVEGYLTDLPTKNGFSYMDFYLRKNNYITYDGESYKRIDSGNRSITWKDDSTSPYGQRKTTIDEVFESFYLILIGICSFLIIIEARQKRREKLNETPNKKKIR